MKNNTVLFLVTVAVIGGFFFLLRMIGSTSEDPSANLVPFAALALITGTVCEFWRISNSLTSVLYSTIAAILLSILAFAPGKSEREYNLNFHIQVWPFVFLMILILIILATHPRETTPQLTEGITLLQSLGLVYLLWESGTWWTEGLSLYLIGPPIAIFCLLSVIHAFTHLELKPSHRLTLSIWSTIIMLVLAVVNLSLLKKIDFLESSVETIDTAAVILQYFLVGVSSIYTLQNFLMVVGFLPGKQTFFNERYYKECKELRKQHIDRYSTEQVSPLIALLAVIFCAGTFWTNHYYQFLPRVTAVWFVLLGFPLILRLSSR